MLLSISSIPDKEFYKKAVTIAKNAHLIAEKKPPVDFDSYHTHSSAVKCFLQRQYLPTVFFASTGVERYLNKVLKKNKWKSLNGDLIREAYNSSIKAVTELLDDSEKSVLRTGKPRPLFCERRNKILHGEIEGLVEIKAPEVEYVKTEKEGIGSYSVTLFLISAYDQLLKFQKFLLKLQS